MIVPNNKHFYHPRRKKLRKIEYTPTECYTITTAGTDHCGELTLGTNPLNKDTDGD